MFVLFASIGPLVLVNVICACVTLAVGFAAGVWFFGGREALPPPVDTQKEADKKAAVRASERTLMASGRLKDLAQGLGDDVGAHVTQVEEINETFHALAAETERDIGPELFEAIGQIVTANTQLQGRLELAEQQIEAQAEEICSHESEARTDSLTGLANRRAFDDELERRYAEWQRKQTPFSLLIMDIDFFKKFNDTHGHQAGDEVLRHVGRQLVQATREMDICCRYGGEEFAVIMPATPLDDAPIVAERIRTMIEKSSVNFEGKVLTVTASVGLASVNGPDAASVVLKRADTALYRSKEAGRNCGHLHNTQDCVPITPGIQGPQAPPAVEPPSTSAMLDKLPDGAIFQDELRRRVAESHRFGVPLSVMHLEVEDYADLRGRYGGQAAHLILNSVAEFVANTLREMDLLARFEDGQFAILLPGSTEAEAAQLGKRVKAAIAGCVIPLGDERLQLSIKQAVAQVHGDDTVDTLLERARASAQPPVLKLGPSLDPARA